MGLGLRRMGYINGAMVEKLDGATEKWQQRLSGFLLNLKTLSTMLYLREREIYRTIFFFRQWSILNIFFTRTKIFLSLRKKKKKTQNARNAKFDNATRDFSSILTIFYFFFPFKIFKLLSVCSIICITDLLLENQQDLLEFAKLEWYNILMEQF